MEEKDAVLFISDKFAQIIANGTDSFDPMSFLHIYSFWRYYVELGKATDDELENAVVNAFIERDMLCAVRGMHEVIAALATSARCKEQYSEYIENNVDIKVEYGEVVCILSKIANTVGECPDAIPDVSIDITLVRHGEDEQDKIGGWSDNRLTDKGVGQAKALAAKLDGNYDALVSSDLRRARETAEIVAQRLGLKIIFDARLRETNNGDCKNLTIDEFRARGCKPYTTLGMDEKYPNGESPNMFYARVRDAFIDIIKKYDGKRIILVTHGGVIAVIRCLVYGYRYTNARKSVPRHATAALVKIERGKSV